MAVVLFHLGFPIWKNGYLGVDIFFVISGFLMARLYNRGTISDFYRRRIDRLFPAYFATALSTVVISSLFILPTEFAQIRDQAVAGALFLSNFHFWSQASYFSAANFNPLLHFWSLAVEFQFYLLVPLLYPLLHGRRAILVGVLIVSLVTCLATQIVSPKTAFFLMPFRVWEFLLGAWVAWGAQATANPKLRDGVLQIAPLGMVLGVILLLPLEPDGRSVWLGHPSLGAVGVTLLTAVVLHHRLPPWFEESFLGRIVAKVGDWSYSIYLVHFPAIALINYVPFSGTQLSAGQGWTPLALALVIILATSVSYLFIESKKLRISFHAPAIMASILSIFISAYTLGAFNESRFNPAERNIFAAMSDRSEYRCGKLFRIIHPGENICSLSHADAGQRILLLGNSHADSIKSAFESTASKYNAATYFLVQNDPLIGTDTTPEGLVAECRELSIGSVAIHYNNLYENPRFTSSLIRFIEQALRYGMRIALIGPVPYYPQSVPQALYQATAAGHRKVGIQITRSQHLDSTRGFKKFAAGVSKIGVQIYDPSELLCPDGGPCLLADPNLKPLYFDGDHLTLTGAEILRPLFVRVLKGLSPSKQISVGSP